MDDTRNTLDNKSQKFGICVRCGEDTLLRCNKCKRAYYCSSICQKAEWDSGHKYVCAPTLEEMLMLKFKLEKSFGYNCWLSNNNAVFFIQENGERKYYATSLTHRAQYRVSRVCVCCGNDPRYTGGQIDKIFKFEKDGMTVCYHRCEECHLQEKVICETTFREPRKCSRMNKIRIIDFWMFVSQKNGEYHKVPKDIALLVFDLYSRLGCC